MNKYSPIIISGPSGCGKDTVVAELHKLDQRIVTAVSATTRAPRDGEIDGVDYYFISEKEFKEKIASGDFLEYASYNGKYYGTLKSEVKRLGDEGKYCVLVIEVCGGANIISLYPDCISVFLMPPSIEELERRLRKRGSESDENIRKRLEIAKTEIERRDIYKYVIVNDALDKTVDEIYNIIEKE